MQTLQFDSVVCRRTKPIRESATPTPQIHAVGWHWAPGGCVLRSAFAVAYITCDPDLRVVLDYLVRYSTQKSDMCLREMVTKPIRESE